MIGKTFKIIRQTFKLYKSSLTADIAISVKFKSSGEENFIISFIR